MDSDLPAPGQMAVPSGCFLATWTLFPVHQNVELMGGVKCDHQGKDKQIAGPGLEKAGKHRVDAVTLHVLDPLPCPAAAA